MILFSITKHGLRMLGDIETVRTDVDSIADIYTVIYEKKDRNTVIRIFGDGKKKSISFACSEFI